MTIEISLDDLLELAEKARTNGRSVMLMTRSTDGKRATLVVAAAERRKHRTTRPAGPKSASADPTS